uniref:G_PROTEIN_RECEP_F1_2 domain-containing protein n=1 Tax=Macrostomum lignano TaxID=282301 RepID=A0A1I8IZL6_9PLAT
MQFCPSSCDCLPPLLVCLGLLGNGLVAYVTLARLRPLTRQNVYFGCIAVVDSIAVTEIGVVQLFLSKGLPWLSGGRLGFILLNQGDWGCRSQSYLLGLCQLLPAAMLLAMVVDRTLSMLAPFRFRTLGPGVALRVALLTAATSAVLAAPILFLTSLVTFSGSSGNFFISCYLTNQRVEALLYWNLLCSPPTLALLAILLTNCLLLFCVARVARERRRHLQGGCGSGGVSDGQSLSGATAVLALSVLMLLCDFPLIAVYWTLRFLPAQTDPTVMHALSESISALMALHLLSQAGNLPVMLHRNRRFRRCFLELVRLRSERPTSWEMRAGIAE